MKYLNVYSVKSYEENGEIKKRYYRVGYIKETEKQSFLNLFNFPNTDFYIFDSEELDSSPQV